MPAQIWFISQHLNSKLLYGMISMLTAKDSTNMGGLQPPSHERWASKDRRWRFGTLRLSHPGYEKL
jgi:hypothetical protein